MCVCVCCAPQFRTFKLVCVPVPAIFHAQYGAPSAIWVNVTVAADGAVGFELQMFNKTATRLGEAMYFMFGSSSLSDGVWLADVLGYLVDPMDVVERGSVHQHGIGQGVVYVDSQGAGVLLRT